LTGTGFAQPNSSPLVPMATLLTRIRIGTTTVPIGSMWRSGFRLMRPCACAVMSPKWRAT
jgi:hypothetical protein